MFEVKTLQQKSTFADYNRPFRCFGYTSLAKKPGRSIDGLDEFDGVFISRCEKNRYYIQTITK